MQIMICPSELKKKLLLEEEGNNKLSSTKYMSKNDFFSHMFFSYDEKTIYYMMKKYHYPVDVCRVYLNHMMNIEDREYSTSKLNFIRDLKKELIENHLLTFTPYFKDSIKDSTILLNHVYDLEKYEEESIHQKVEIPDVELNFPVYAFNRLEDEVHYVCVKIRELIKQGVDYSHIYLCNVDEEYYYTLEKMFSYYKIPIMIPYRNSIYSTSIVQKYLKTREVNLEDNSPINKKLVSVLSQLVELEEDEIKEKILIDTLKSTMIPNPVYENCVTIKNLKDNCFNDDEYVFVLGFNQDHLPSIYKDIDYFNESEKEEVGYYSVSELNKREKKVTAYLLSQIQNIFVSYKNSSPFQKYYPSSMIGDYKLEVQNIEIEDIHYSSIYNQIRLGEAMDQYMIYGEKNKNLDTYLKYYENIYQTYDSSYSGINRDLYLENLKVPLRLSYTSINSYAECPFKYYLQYVLKLGDFEDTFAALVGSLYHKILSIYKNNNFNLDKEWDKYLEEKDLSLKDTVLLVRIRKDLEELLNVLREQQTYTKYDTEYLEKEIKIPLRNDIHVEFVGYVDKIMMYQNISDTYFSIVDYKTGTIDTHIEPMKYGLHMQLPVYLYLIYFGKVFDNPIFTGIYYQNILFNYPTWSDKLEEEKKDRYLLKGYSTDNIDTLSKFDLTFKESNYIKSMKYTDEKGFDRFSKLLSDEMVEKIVEYTKKEIEETTQSILDCDFKIAPKVYGKENISCKYCDYKDICFRKDSDLVYLDKVEDFSFLGGEE